MSVRVIDGANLLLVSNEFACQVENGGDLFDCKDRLKKILHNVPLSGLTPQTLWRNSITFRIRIMIKILLYGIQLHRVKYRSLVPSGAGSGLGNEVRGLFSESTTKC